MLRAVTVSVLAATLAVAACNGAPSAVKPTLAAVEALGAACGDGQPDNVPSGLVEWQCRATDGGEADKQLIAGVTVDGNDHGVARLIVAMDRDRLIATTERVGDFAGPDRLRGALGLVVDRLPPLSVAPALAGALDGWTGEEISAQVGNARVHAWCLEEGACDLEISPIGNPNEPLQLP